MRSLRDSSDTVSKRKSVQENASTKLFVKSGIVSLKCKWSIAIGWKRTENNNCQFLVVWFPLWQSHCEWYGRENLNKYNYHTKSTNREINYRSKDVTQTQQRPESPKVTFTWYASKYKVYNTYKVLRLLYLSQPTLNSGPTWDPVCFTASHLSPYGPARAQRVPSVLALFHCEWNSNVMVCTIRTQPNVDRYADRRILCHSQSKREWQQSVNWCCQSGRSVLINVDRDRGTGSPGRPSRLSHSSWALKSFWFARSFTVAF